MRTLLNRHAVVMSLEERPRPSRWKILSPVSAFVAVLWPILLVGCASIESFQASPRNLCAGDTVTVKWQATGHVSLDANPSCPALGLRTLKDQSPSRFNRPHDLCSVHKECSHRKALKRMSWSL